MFWRAKTSKSADGASSNEEDTASVAPGGADYAAPSALVEASASTAAQSPASSTSSSVSVPAIPASSSSSSTSSVSPPALSPSTSSNVVSLVSQRLADRLADVSPGAEVATIGREALIAGDVLQSEALEALRVAITQSKSGAHILVMAPPGAAPRTAVLQLAETRAETLEAPPDWIYVPDWDRPGRLVPVALPHGEGARFVSDANAALEKSAAMFDRLVNSDEHRLSVELLDEEFRQRNDKALEGMRRRAEAQNIAVIKSLNGYVLAPMHEGKAVRPEVFRALPGGLQRNVEAKVGALEQELQSLIASLPEAEMEADDKHAALIRQVALRAVKPNLAVLKKMYAKTSGVTAVADRLEQGFLQRAAALVRNPIGGPTVATLFSRSLGVLIADGASGAPVVVSRGIVPEELSGEIGRDVFGAPAIRAGDLMRANGGILIVEAWRLVALPQTWAALSAALETRLLQPKAAPGLAVTAEPVPLTLTLILLADPVSWRKLEALDPGIAQHFSKVAEVDKKSAADVQGDRAR
ncbi:MAG: ATP-dependent protease [Hyphomicrobium sp.]|nr:MAG: ATP-dependent protease [Hyphomicrobium sp.]